MSTLPYTKQHAQPRATEEDQISAMIHEPQHCSGGPATACKCACKVRGTRYPWGPNHSGISSLSEALQMEHQQVLGDSRNSFIKQGPESASLGSGPRPNCSSGPRETWRKEWHKDSDV